MIDVFRWTHRVLNIFLALAAFMVCCARAETITGAEYSIPVTRYGHFALGRPHEYARLTVSTDAGRRVVLELPQDEVFEDLTPRLVSLGANEPVLVLAIVSRQGEGARLVLIEPRGDRLAIAAQSPAIGTPMRWQNPVAVVDLDGDGQREMATVTTPHMGGTLRIYRREGHRLVEVASLGGFSNHAYGSAELGLSTSMRLVGHMHLLVPDTARQRLRIVALAGDRLVEVGACKLPAQVVGAINVLSPTEISLALSTGTHKLSPQTCLGPRAPLASPSLAHP